MAFLVRNTFSPEYDVTRNWSAWIGGAWNSETEAILDIADHCGVLSDYQERYDDLSDEELAEKIQDRESYDIRWNEAYRKFQHVHHEGLAGFALEAETEAEALAEALAGAANDRYQWFGFADQTHGKVRLVQQIASDIYLYECDDTSKESDY